MTKSQSVKPVDPLHSFMEALERMEGLPTDTRHHILFMVAVLVGKLEGTLGLPELGISPSFDLILSWGNLQVIITPTQDDDPMFTVGAIDGVWAYLVQTPFEVVQH